jgi:hypothetical protein
MVYVRKRWFDESYLANKLYIRSTGTMSLTALYNLENGVDIVFLAWGWCDERLESYLTLGSIKLYIVQLNLPPYHVVHLKCVL